MGSPPVISTNISPPTVIPTDSSVPSTLPVHTGEPGMIPAEACQETLIPMDSSALISTNNSQPFTSLIGTGAQTALPVDREAGLILMETGQVANLTDPNPLNMIPKFSQLPLIRLGTC